MTIEETNALLKKESKLELWKSDSNGFVNQRAGLYDICRWIIDSYPKDVFTGCSKDKGVRAVIVIRKECEKILKWSLTK